MSFVTSRSQKRWKKVMLERQKRSINGPLFSAELSVRHSNALMVINAKPHVIRRPDICILSSGVYVCVCVCE